MVHLQIPGQTTPTAPTVPLHLMVNQAGSLQGSEFLAMIIPFDEGELQAQAMENWFQACASDEPFCLELVGTRREQGFLLRASSEAQLTLLCKQFQAQYPQAEIQRVAPSADPLILHPGEQAIIGDFALTQPSWMPLKTFTGKTLAEQGNDPLANLLAAMEAVWPGERIICQLALVRAPDDWIGPAIRKAVEHPLQEERDRFAASLKGTDASSTARGWRIFFSFFGVFGALWGYRLYREGAQVPLLLLILGAVLVGILGLVWWIKNSRREIYDMKLVAEKLVRAAFYMQLRVIVVGKKASTTPETLRSHLTGMEVAYRQFSLASANSLAIRDAKLIDVNHTMAGTLCLPSHAFAYHHPWLRFFHHGWSKFICNGLELSGMFHLPQQFTDLPLVKRISVKHLLFSPEVSHAVAESQDPLPPVAIGYSKHRSFAIKVLLPFLTQFSHKFLVGRSRYGKSVLIQLLIAGVMRHVRDASPQPGIFCIDPHRDLIFDILKQIPPHRAKEVLLLDFTESTHIVGLNPLDATQGLTRDQMVSSLMSCFERIWEKYWGPRMSFFLKNICLLLITLNFRLCAAGRANEQYTLLDINPVLQYKDYATLVLNQLDRSETWHQELLAWFQHTYWTLPTNSSFRQEIILPILSKMSVFNDNIQLRRIFSQPITTAAVHKAITEGKIVLCALSSRDMDEASVNILGSTLINTLHYAFTRQQDVPLMQRRKCAVFVDELQNFTGSQFSKLLSEDAKWGCSALFTTQNLKRLNQLQDGLQEMLLSNCDNLFAFNVSAADAKILESEFQERVTQKHILSQPRLHCYARVAIPGYPLQFASVTLAQPPSWGSSPDRQALADEIQRENHARFNNAADIDRQHEVHLKKFLDVSLFADKIQKDAESIEYHRQRREEEERRIQELQQDADQQQNNESDDDPADQQGEVKLPTARYDATSAGKGGQTGREQGQNTSTPPPKGNAASANQGDNDADGLAKRKRTRSRRMNRMKSKAPVGTPFPGIESSPETGPAGEVRPLPPPSSSMSWGREGGERGERGA
ncbi:hypothetical protein KDA_75290 [Dictyobacter alpinus]|uniref:TraD/TraG TraM recognition site domain-containing protein n=1 Tax=Dictyobacter alpinus TaxID=2014873 RepID=A0A402BL06_9CHLR|nr:type IV secretory system conjugative DNA transfer family protein [Dictyobacter alpinus]GCE32045.1 hypothetical protein KDA_75290 [Dictyobacter alpinus]